MHPAVRNAAIARGARFLIMGQRFGPANTLSMSLGPEATAVRVPIIHVENGRVEARMPADAPLGALPLRIIRDGEASPVATIRVVESAFGIFSQNGHGWGPGQIYNSTGALNTVSNSARRGHRMAVQGTGLG